MLVFHCRTCLRQDLASPLDLKKPMLQLRTPFHPLTAFLSGWSATFALCVVLQPSLADEPTKSDEPTKPATTETKPATTEPKPGEGGVSISLKLLPSKKDEPAKEPEKTESKADEKAKESKESKPKADEKESAKKPDKSQPTGTVELKLIPQKPPEPEKKPEPEKPSAEKKPDPTKPTGTVEMSLLPPKEKAPSADSGKVTIELSMPKTPATRSVSDLPESNVSGSDLKKPPKPTSSTESTEQDSKSKTESTKSESNKAEAGDSKKGSKSRGGDPGDPGDGEAGPLPEQPGDIPLTQEPHPFDAPAAKATEEESRFSKSSGKKLSPADRERNERITAVLEYFKTHHENVVRRGPWALMHTILPYGVETEIIAGKQKVNAIGWLCHNGISAKQRIFQPTQTGFRTNVGPGVQGHEGQFLAILAQSHVHRDYPIQIGNKKYTINDLIKYEMATCREKTELTFKLIGFAHYLEPNKTWKDNRGRSWSIEKLVAEELAQPINGEACGGTHRLMGLTCAVVSRQEAGLKLTGHFERAEKFLNDYVEYTLKMQNPDGSFSTEWFERRADEPNIERKVQTTGHITEWLVYTLPDEHLRSPEIEKAIDFLLGTIGENPSRDWPIGPRGHSLRALDLFQKRVYKGQDVSTETNLAKPAAKSLQR